MVIIYRRKKGNAVYFDGKSFKKGRKPRVINVGKITHRHKGSYRSRTPKGNVVYKRRPIHSQALMKKYNFRGKVTVKAPKKGYIQFSNNKKSVILKNPITMEDKEDEFDSNEWNWLLNKFNTTPDNISFDDAKSEIETYRERKERREGLFNDLLSKENEWWGLSNNLKSTKEDMENKKNELQEMFKEIKEIDEYLYGEVLHDSVNKEIQEIYDEI
tara:strand:- start:289 stop:933 length:645 start_codon:yes stop_codon:yes gene_type:complete